MEISELVESLSAELVEDYAEASGEDVYEEGKSLAERVSMVAWNPRRGVLSGTVTSLRNVRHKVKVATRGGLDGTCTCSKSSDCEHAVALLLHLLEEADRYTETAIEEPQRPSRPSRSPSVSTPPPAPQRSAAPPVRPAPRVSAVSDSAAPGDLVTLLVAELSGSGNVQRIGVLLTQLEYSHGVSVNDLEPLVRVAHLGSGSRRSLPGIAARVNGVVSRCVADSSLAAAGSMYLQVVLDGGASVEPSLWVGMSDRLRQEVLDTLHEKRLTLPGPEVGPVQDVLEARARRDNRSSELLRLVRTDPRGSREALARSLQAKVVESAARYSSIVT